MYVPKETFMCLEDKELKKGITVNTEDFVASSGNAEENDVDSNVFSVASYWC
jgi:uncharacterized protein YtpQ (UPF0354 family)